MRLRTHFSVAAVALMAMAAALPGTALASHVQCGDVLTTSTTLDSDLGPCSGDGLVAGADGIRIDLNGHAIRGSGGGSGDVLEGDTKDGVDMDEHANVTVLNGEISAFDTGVRIYEGGGGNRVTNLSSHNNRVGVFLYESTQNRVVFSSMRSNGYGVYIYEAASNRVIGNSMFANTFALYAVEASHNTITDNTAIGSGILGFQVTTESDHNSVNRNTIAGSAGVGILVSAAEGNRFEDNVIQDHRLAGVLAANAPGTELIRNTIENNAYAQSSLSSTAAGIWITNTDGAVADRNRVRNYPLGIYATSSTAGLTRNDVRGSAYDGIYVPSGSPATSVDRNTASSNGDDGIDVEEPSATVSRNTADLNGDYGIESVPGTDGGGNRASGNGNPAQCLNVACK